MFQIQSTISKVSTLADKTIRIQCDCQELPPDQMAEVFRLKDAIGWMCYKENPLIEKDLPTELAEFEEKSPSKRLRDRMMAYYIKKNGNTKGFQTFYEDYLDSIGQRFLDKIIDY